jgi:LysR family cys regulon transcriptional activator
MNLQQLRYLITVVDSGLNITAAANRAHTSQPGISRQLKLLEEELGFQLFARHGRSLAKLTPAGTQVLARAQRVMHELRSIKRLAEEMGDERTGSLSIGTTHTQARYVLPGVISAFRKRYPDVKLHLQQGTSEQIAEMIQSDRVDFAIATGGGELFRALTLLPCYRWHRTLIVPRGHPLATRTQPTLEELAQFPLITYSFSFTGPSSLGELFASAGLEPNFALTARDADVIKTYVRIGLGVGIVASVAVDPAVDTDLVSIDLQHLLPAHTTWLGFRKSVLLRRFMYDFIEEFAGHLDRRRVDRAREAATQEHVDRLFAEVELPQR